MPKRLTVRAVQLAATAAAFSTATVGLVGEASARVACPAHALCGAVSVPLDRSMPAGPTLNVAYALIPRTESRRPSLGTIATNPGGPGITTIGQAPLYTKLLAPLLARRDLLLVDARGTGRSGALRCSLPSPSSPLLLTPSELGDRCLSTGNQPTTKYGSAAVADDLEAVRSALHLDRLDLWGDSYGTFLMPVYAARYPQHVRSIVLDGAYPAAFDPWGRDVLAGTRRVINLACQRSGACSGPRVLRQIARLARELRAHPISVRVPLASGAVLVTAGEQDLATLTHAGGDPERLRWLPVAVDEALRGDRRRLRALIAESRLADADSTEIDPELFSLVTASAVACHDYPRAFSLSDPPAQRRLDYARGLAALPPSAFAPFSAEAWLATDIDAGPKCIDSPVDATAGSPLAGLRLPAVPVLVQSGDLDSNTPIEQGRAATAEFPRATFAVIANAGHTPDLQPCGLTMAMRFVRLLHTDADACRNAGTPPVIEPVRRP